MSARRTGAWLALAAALLAGCLVYLTDQKETPAAPAEQEEQAVMITDISVGSLAALALSSGGTSTALMVAGDQIILLDAPQDVRLSDQLLKAFAYRMAHMPAERVLGTIESPAEYGFDAYTAAVVLLGADGSRTRLFLGSEAPFDAGWYLMREDDPSLYLIDDMTAQMMRYTMDDFRQLDLFPAISAGGLSSVNRMMIAAGGQVMDIYGLVQDGAVYFYMAAPYDCLLSWERVANALVSPLAALEKAAYVSGNVSPAKYGLYDPDAIRLTTVIGGQESTLLFAPADELHYYCAKKGANDVALVRREDAAFLLTQATDLMDSTLYARGAADVDAVRVYAEDFSGEMAMSGAGMMLRGRIGERTLDQAETVDLYGRLTMLPPAETIAEGQSVSGQPLLEMHIALKDGTTDRISLIPVSGRRCAVVINGDATFATYTAAAEEIIRVCRRAFQP